MIDSRAIDRLASWLAGAERVLLVTHEQPDGDAVASALALRSALKGLGKEARCVSRDPVPPTFQFLPDSQAFETDFIAGDYDVAITLDCGDSRRTGFGERLTEFARLKRRLVNIDHHPKNDLHRLANLNVIDYDAAATTQIIYYLFRHFRWPMDHRTATCLLCGLHTDTGGFKHPNTTAEVLEIAADLLAHGGRLREITHHMRCARSVPMLRLWGIALNRLRFHPELHIASSFVSLGDVTSCEATHHDIAGVVNLIKNIPNTTVAMLFIEQPDGTVKVSLRTDADGVDVSRLAALFGGGGLKKAGGFSVPAHLLEAIEDWHLHN